MSNQRSLQGVEDHEATIAQKLIVAAGRLEERGHAYAATRLLARAYRVMASQIMKSKRRPPHVKIQPAIDAACEVLGDDFPDAARILREIGERDLTAAKYREERSEINKAQEYFRRRGINFRGIYAEDLIELYRGALDGKTVRTLELEAEELRRREQERWAAMRDRIEER